MTNNKPIRRIAIIGTGVIGASWTALFLAKGLQVVATDIAPNAEAALRKFVETAWPALERLGLSPGASQSNLTFTADCSRKRSTSADLVQENGPERIDFKQKLYGQLDELLPPDVIIASSSSGLTMSEIQIGRRVAPGALRHRPSVQSAAPDPAGRDRRRGKDLGSDDSARSGILYVDRASRPCACNKEVPGHVANRLQAALAREVYYLVAEGVVSAADVDTALCWGPGLRWGIMGNMMLNHLGGGPGGIEHFFQQFTGPMTAWWKVLGLAGADAGGAKEAHRQRPCRGRIALHRRAGGAARRGPAGAARAAHQGREDACHAQSGCSRRLEGRRAFRSQVTRTHHAKVTK